MLDVAGLKPEPGKPLDGESIMPLIRRKGPLRRQAIYFHYPNYAFHRGNRLGGAIRQGDYKLIEYYDDGSVELYNLAKDIGEHQDLSRQLPQKAHSMKEKLDQWLRTSGARMPEHIERR
ncbi:MAG TPA: hypothetical protein DIU00_17560 [Phycisphaerales bacterium]|nr:hypothetical protein [Phycisphaerales bacterium]